MFPSSGNKYIQIMRMINVFAYNPCCSSFFDISHFL